MGCWFYGAEILYGAPRATERVDLARTYKKAILTKDERQMNCGRLPRASAEQTIIGRNTLKTVVLMQSRCPILGKWCYQNQL